MKKRNRPQSKVKLAFLLATLMALQVLAQTGGRGASGEWQIKVNAGDRSMQSVLWLYQDKDDQLAGKWISFWGVSDLKELKYENDTLSFKRTSRFRGTETSMTFVGQIKRAKLTGTLSRGQDESAVEGQRLRFMPRPAGTWDIKIKSRTETHAARLRIEQGRQGQLQAEWLSPQGRHEITDIKFKNPNFSFKDSSGVSGQQRDAIFTGEIKGHRLTGAFHRAKGNNAAQGRRVGAALVGRWALSVPSDSGTRTQILRVYPDLTGRYGPMPIDKVKLDGDEVTFKAKAEFRGRQFSYSFKGKLEQKTLTGELTSSRGTRSIEGQKLVLQSGKGKAASSKKTFRKPDVVFVPTPQKVVDRMLELAQMKKDDVLYDLGCGDGIIVVTAARKYGCRSVGFDISAKRVRESRANVIKHGVEDLARIERADIFTLDLSQASVITLYLLPELNVKLIPQLDKLRPGVRIVSHDFDMQGVRPDEVITVEDPGDTYGNHTIYLWTTPLNKEPTSGDQTPIPY